MRTNRITRPGAVQQVATTVRKWKDAIQAAAAIRDRHHRITLILVIANTLALSAVAQTPVTVQTPIPDTSAGPVYTLHQNAQEVLLYCTVLDRKGNLVTDLDRPAFSVFEDKHPVVLTHFNHKDVPISLALVLDDSGSMKDKRAAVQSAGLELIKASNPEDETSVINFADTAYVDQDFTDNLPRLQTALAQSKTVSGGTALFDTVIEAANHLSKDSHHSKQVIVLVTDGRDNASAADLSAAIRRVQATDGPVIYTIGLLYEVPGIEARRAHHDLQSLSDETGGIAFFPGSVEQVEEIAAEIARDIRNQYTVAYRPPSNATGRVYHTIAVRASEPGHGSFTVRTRKGYMRTQADASSH